MFYKTGVLKNLAKFTEKHLCWNLFLNKVGLQHKCFPVNIANFLRTPLLQNTSRQLLHLMFQKFKNSFFPDEFQIPESKTRLKVNKKVPEQLSNTSATITDKIFGTKWRNPVKLDRKKKFGFFLLFFNCYYQRLISC